MADQPPAKGKKILGMPRTTGIIVIGLAAVVVGYFVISKFSGKGKGQGSGGGGGGGFGPTGGSSTFVTTVKDWQGHGHLPAPKRKPPIIKPKDGGDK